MQINLLVKPAAEITIADKLIYLFPASLAQVSDYCSLEEDVAASQNIRLLLPLFSSLKAPQNFREEREPLPDELVSAMSEAELERLAGIYVGISLFDKVRAWSEESAPVNRLADEIATSFLDRLLRAEGRRVQRVFEKINAL